MRLIAGKVLMDSNCPEELRDDAETGYADSKALIERVCVAVRFLATTINDQEILACIEGDQGHMPGAAMIVDTLAAIRNEGPQLIRIDTFTWRRNHDNHAAGLERHECLAAKRMPFDHIDT
jgi:hypothetical protein